MIKSLPSRLFSKDRPIVSQAYYRFVGGSGYSDKTQNDARLFIFPDGTAKLSDADGLNSKTCEWWQIILPDNKFMFYIFFSEEAD